MTGTGFNLGWWKICITELVHHGSMTCYNLCLSRCPFLYGNSLVGNMECILSRWSNWEVLMGAIPFWWNTWKWGNSHVHCQMECFIVVSLNIVVYDWYWLRPLLMKNMHHGSYNLCSSWYENSLVGNMECILSGWSNLEVLIGESHFDGIHGNELILMVRCYRFLISSYVMQFMHML